MNDCSSAEEAAQELAEDETQVNNIVHSFRLTQTSFDKKGYMVYLKVRSSASLIASTER